MSSRPDSTVKHAAIGQPRRQKSQRGLKSPFSSMAARHPRYAFSDSSAPATSPIRSATFAANPALNSDEPLFIYFALACLEQTCLQRISLRRADPFLRLPKFLFRRGSSLNSEGTGAACPSMPLLIRRQVCVPIRPSRAYRVGSQGSRHYPNATG